MTGKELIEKIQELNAEDKEIMVQPRPWCEFEEIQRVEIAEVGWSREIVGIVI